MDGIPNHGTNEQDAVLSFDADAVSMLTCMSMGALAPACNEKVRNHPLHLDQMTRVVGGLVTRWWLEVTSSPDLVRFQVGLRHGGPRTVLD